jgi:magnesium-transporting ATPase (P-type)
MAKKRKVARKRVAPKPARKRRAGSPDATINTLVILVVIVMVLGGLFLYAQNKKQAALWPNLMQAIAALSAPTPTALPATPQPAALLQTIQPAAGVVAPTQPAAAAKAQAPPHDD